MGGDKGSNVFLADRGFMLEVIHPLRSPIGDWHLKWGTRIIDLAVSSLWNQNRSAIVNGVKHPRGAVARSPGIASQYFKSAHAKAVGPNVRRYVRKDFVEPIDDRVHRYLAWRKTDII